MNISLSQSKLALSGLESPYKNTRKTAHTFILLSALAAFEVFNYSTTVYALRSMLGSMSITGVQWATILAIVFCCVDIAGITQLFLPTSSTKTEYDRFLFISWLLTAGINALFTWHGISLAIAIQQAQTGWVMDSDIMIKTIPAFMALLVWLIRILIIGAFSQLQKATPRLEQIQSTAVVSNIDPWESYYGSLSSSFPNAQSRSNRSNSIPHTIPVKQEPTYQGFPIRYKTY